MCSKIQTMNSGMQIGDSLIDLGQGHRIKIDLTEDTQGQDLTGQGLDHEDTQGHVQGQEVGIKIIQNQREEVVLGQGVTLGQGHAHYQMKENTRIREGLKTTIQDQKQKIQGQNQREGIIIQGQIQK